MATKPLIEQLYDLGGYQIKSQYRVLFPKGIPGFTSVVTTISTVFPTLNELTLRQSETFSVPQRETNTYERFFQGLKEVRTSAVDNTSKEFTLRFALDENFKVFSMLNQLYRRTFDDLNGIVGCEAETRFPIVLEFVGFNKIGTSSSFSFNKPPRYAIIFQAAKIKSLRLDDPDHSSGDIQMVEAAFIYAYQLEYIASAENLCSTDMSNTKYPESFSVTLPGTDDYTFDYPFEIP